MTLVWRKSRNQRSAMLLLLAIADHAHDDGKGAFPSVKTLARKTRQSERNVQLLLNTLRASRELTVLEGEGPHGCNLYHVNVNMLESLDDWETLDTGDESDADTKSSARESSPPKTLHPENPRAENAENFTGGMKNGANSNNGNPENKTENEDTPREISPKPLTVNLILTEPSGDSAFSKAEIQTEIKSLFHLHPEFDWSWLDPLCLEIPDQALHIETARRIFNLGKSNAPFDRIRFTRMLRFARARASLRDKSKVGAT